MPIDDALEKIQETKTSSEDQKDQSIAVPSSLFSKAQLLLGAYLTEKYFVNDKVANLSTFLKTMGPFVLKVSPKKNQSSSHIGFNSSRSREHTLSLVDTIDKETWRQCASSFAEEYLKNTDIFEISESLDLEKDGEKYIPELRAIKSLCYSKFRAESSPYDLVMGMNSKHRALIAVSIGKAIEKSEIIINNDPNTPLKDILLSSIPPLKCIAETAKEYEVKELKPAIEELNKIVQEYSDKW